MSERRDWDGTERSGAERTQVVSLLACACVRVRVCVCVCVWLD